MKPLFKSAVIVFTVFCMTSLTAFGQRIEGGQLIGRLVSTEFFGEYHGTVNGSLHDGDGPLPYFEMSVFPNGYVVGGFGHDRDYDDQYEFGGRVDKNGFIRAPFSFDGKDYEIGGVISKGTRQAVLWVTRARSNKSVAIVTAAPERTADFAPKGSRLGFSIHVDDEGDTSFDISFSTGGTFESSDDSGTYTYRRVGRDRGQVILNGRGRPHQITIFFTDGDASNEGIVYDVTTRKFYNWEVNSD